MSMATSVSAADLAALENLLNEFFAGQTSNARKREIEQVLAHFGEQTNAWHQCLGLLAANKDNHFVSMFVLTTLENIIKRKWIGMPGDEKVCQVFPFYSNEFSERFENLQTVKFYRDLFLISVFADL